MDKGRQTRGRRFLFASLIVIGSVAFQIASILPRTADIGWNIGPRTSVHYFEDFFQAAQKIDEPSDAFSKYPYIREHYNLLRIATHPPGLIYVYRHILDFCEWSQPALSPFANWCKGFFQNDWVATEYGPVDCMALFLVSLFKLLASQTGLLGVWLILGAFPEGRQVAGRAMALFALVPGMVIFAFSLDGILAGISAMSIGFLLLSLREGKWRLAFAVAAGVCGFLQSMLAFQVATTGALGFIAAVLYLWGATGNWRDTARRIWPPLVVAGGTALLLWMIQYLMTGYFFIQYLLEGIAYHNKGPIHMNRSRIAWLFFNQWDVFFFTGLAWIPFWCRRQTWWPVRGNPLLYGFLAVWILIHIGDGIRGETARLVMFAYPILVAALVVRNSEILEKKDYLLLGGLLTAQTVVFAVTLSPYYP
jgi:hypothetical protein